MHKCVITHLYTSLFSSRECLCLMCITISILFLTGFFASDRYQGHSHTEFSTFNPTQNYDVISLFKSGRFYWIPAPIQISSIVMSSLNSAYDFLQENIHFSHQFNLLKFQAEFERCKISYSEFSLQKNDALIYSRRRGMYAVEAPRITAYWWLR